MPANKVRRYVEPAINNGYEVEIVDVRSPWSKNFKELEKRCVDNNHNVPIESIKKMAKKWHRTFTVEQILNAKRPKPRVNKDGRKTQKKKL